MPGGRVRIDDIPVGTTTDDLREFFDAYGYDVDIHHKTDGNGDSSGVAYVDLFDDKALEQFIAEIDGMNFRGSELGVRGIDQQTRQQWFDEGGEREVADEDWYHEA